MKNRIFINFNQKHNIQETDRRISHFSLCNIKAKTKISRNILSNIRIILHGTCSKYFCNNSPFRQQNFSVCYYYLIKLCRRKVILKKKHWISSNCIPHPPAKGKKKYIWSSQENSNNSKETIMNSMFQILLQ